ERGTIINRDASAERKNITKSVSKSARCIEGGKSIGLRLADAYGHYTSGNQTLQTQDLLSYNSIGSMHFILPWSRSMSKIRQRTDRAFERFRNGWLDERY